MQFSIFIHSLRYLPAFVIPCLLVLNYRLEGAFTFLPLFYAFVVIPVGELLFSASEANISKNEERQYANAKLFDLILVLACCAHFACLAFFLVSIDQIPQFSVSWFGHVTAMGLMCGVFGINVAHELGHRKERYFQLFALAMLSTSLYMHFFIEHNRGHHKNVATDQDPASAKAGEPLFFFWFRSIFGAYKGAWKLENDRLQRKGFARFSLKNQMIQMHIFQGLLIVFIGVVFGASVLLAFLGAGTFGIFLLETVNYIEHYGLRRRVLEHGKYERAEVWHSWNSNHLFGRATLFELSRHSDHHFIASRKYQILRHHQKAPQLPTGYPGMMLLALVPPLFFRVMHPKINQNQPHEEGAIFK
ncbi:alkane 1-monooxygenase [Persicobacter psychrovividus]|uniref:Alkane 1-monooxygenase n=1 Tax=Persicobacter psychrovividus TaxID=387638 RepID=A0ABN6LEQ4_9BACT|nr:alkane 1-monooxygenase [Persicobacter psychrovividus]